MQFVTALKNGLGAPAYVLLEFLFAIAAGVGIAEHMGDARERNNGIMGLVLRYVLLFLGATILLTVIWTVIGIPM